MGFLFRLWFYATALGLIVYVPTYFFANDEIDAIQEFTPRELMYYTGMTTRDYDAFEKRLGNIGVDTAKSIIDALDDNKYFSNVDVDYVEGEEVSNVPPYLKVVAITAKINDDVDFKLSFIVSPKHFLRSWSQVTNVASLAISRNGKGVELLPSSEAEIALFSMLSSDDATSSSSVEYLLAQLPEKSEQTETVTLESLKGLKGDDFNKAFNQYLNQPSDTGSDSVDSSSGSSSATQNNQQSATEPMMSDTTLPFIGKRAFNFDGGSGTEEIVTIYEDGRTVIEGCGTADALFDDTEPSCTVFYDGAFSSVIKAEFDFYRITREAVIKVDADGNRLADCEEKGVNCISSLYSIE
ncbi:hypothetical protein SJU67_00460 [Aeromonas caviae]|uniref:hypothetical protein n=1 Tax=Aeromonas caviae TaxID=648 RepID=UPI0029DC2148|nr:hypothetical protein [Aeromonas caviae]MDX7690277.1 hypothetical protein [Aeromonas caviae]